MKKNLLTFIAIAALAVIGTITSCTKTCDTGYEGSDCKTKMNAKFAGTYNVSDTAVISGASSVFTYVMTVTASSSEPNAITMQNFGGFGTGTSVAGTVDGTTLTGTNKTIGIVSLSNISGSINGNTFQFSYTAIDTTGTSVDHATGTK